MRDQAQGGYERLQYDVDGQIVGSLVKAPFGQWVLLLNAYFVLVTHPETGNLRLWDLKKHKLVELAKDERRDES